MQHLPPVVIFPDSTTTRTSCPDNPQQDRLEKFMIGFRVREAEGKERRGGE
jgi:hypothetical protein